MTYHDTDLPLSPEQQAAQLLAYYDARGVAGPKLRSIFRCTDEALAQARTSDDYTEFAAEEQARIEDQARNADELWNDLESRALGDLRDTMDAIADPRTLLGIAVQANKAGRRSNQFGQQAKQVSGSAVINADQLAGPTKVVRLRTRFAEMLAQPDGSKRLVEREAEITTTTQHSLDESMDPAVVKGLLRSSLGVDTRNMQVAQKMGPDELIMDGSVINFDLIPEE